MDKNFAAYICTGCGIGDAVNVEDLVGVVTGDGGIAECKTHAALCSAEGLEMIKADIAGGANSIVIGACSPRVMTEEFDFGEDKIVSRASLREQVAWCKPEDADPEYTQELASDYMRMACVRARKSELPEPYQLEQINKNVLVIGGGVAGLTAAKEAAKAGCQVTLVEAADQLGGKAVNWRKQFPSQAPWTDLEEPTVPAMVADVEADGNITVRTKTEVARIGGAPGAFQAHCQTGRNHQRVGCSGQGWCRRAGQDRQG